MKLKLLLFILLLPLVSFGASTNKIDNLWVPSSARFTFGTPALGEVLTSDAAGFATWLPITAGDVFAASNNVFTGTVNRFTNNVVVNGTFFSTNSATSQTNGWYGYGLFEPNNAVTGRAISILAQGTHVLIGHIRESGNGIDISTAGGTVTMNAVTPFEVSGAAAFLSTLDVAGNTALGNAVSDVVSFNGRTWNAGNGLDLNSGVMWFPANVTGNITNGSSTAITNLFFLPRGSTSNFVWTSINTATGEGRWEAKSAGGGGGDVFTTSNNTFAASTTNTFNGQTTTSNLLVRSTVTVGTNGNPVSGIFFTNYTITVPIVGQFTAFSTNLTFTGVVPGKTSYAPNLGTGTTNLYVYSFDTISADTVRISIFNPITTVISSHSETIGATAFVHP